jgi:predicted PurR-regulated permease PerM
VLGPIVTEQASRFGDQLPRWLGDPKLIDRIPLPDWLAPYRDRLAQWIRQHLADEGPSIGPAARQIGYGLLKVAEVLITIVLVPILSFLFLKDGPTMREHYLAWAERQAHAAMWRGLMEDLDRMLGRYMRALLLLALATSVSYSIAFTIAGMPYGLLLAIGAGILEFVPVAGPLAAALATLAVAAFSGYPHLLGIVAFLVLYRLFQDYVLGPYLMGGGASVPPLLVLLGLLAGEELGGIAGVFLSVPLLAAVRVLVLRVTQAMRQPRAAATRVLAGSEHSDPPP